MSNLVSIIAFILIIGLVIFIHEFGHFLLAKKNGVGVLEFAVGMGPTVLSKVYKGTKYSLKLVPFGGYCLMLGQEMGIPDPSNEGEEVVGDEEHAYDKKPVWVRIAVTAAGPVFNFLLALVLAILLTSMIGVTTTRIGGVSSGYPGQEAGLQAGDVITEINGSTMHFFKEISLYVSLHEGETLEVVYERNGEEHSATIVPKWSEEDARYYIGISASSRESGLGVIEVLKYGFFEFEYNTSVVFKSLGMLFTGKASVDDLSGPVGMAGMVSDIVTEVEEDTQGESIWTTIYWILVNLINFTVLISANLGVMNLLPIPGMDGGRLIFLLIELIMGRPVPKKAEGIITIAGFIFLFALMVFVLFNDVRKVFF